MPCNISTSFKLTGSFLLKEQLKREQVRTPRLKESKTTNYTGFGLLTTRCTSYTIQINSDIAFEVNENFQLYIIPKETPPPRLTVTNRTANVTIIDYNGDCCPTSLVCVSQVCAIV